MSCSETFTSADGPLRITNLDLRESLSGPFVGGVHTPTHRKRCQEWAKSICDHINSSCGVDLKVVGMEFSLSSRGYVLLEGPASDKNYALLRRPDIGRKLVAKLYFPDHWRTEYILTPLSNPDQPAERKVTQREVVRRVTLERPWPSEVIEVLNREGSFRVRVFYRGDGDGEDLAKEAFASFFARLKDAGEGVVEWQAAITFVKSNLEDNHPSAQYSEEEMIPPPAPLRLGGIQTFGRKTFASLTSSFGPGSSTKSSIVEPVHKRDHSAESDTPSKKIRSKFVFKKLTKPYVAPYSMPSLIPGPSSLTAASSSSTHVASTPSPPTPAPQTGAVAPVIEEHATSPPSPPAGAVIPVVEKSTVEKDVIVRLLDEDIAAYEEQLEKITAQLVKKRTLRAYYAQGP